ncbi:MAG TPA: hypothetical protein PLX85_09740, partial [Dehalococcoidia bacterium]|nr:hypothetical protein [Dehalococcoidia bacterium]
WLTSIYWLRVVAIIGSALEIIYFTYTGGDLQVAVIWTAVFIAINTFHLVLLTRERLSLRLPEAGRAVLGLLGLASIVFVTGLVQAARGGEVTLAVDPFAMHLGPFEASAWLFPDYRAWTGGVVLRTVVWLIAAGVFGGWLQRDRLGDAVQWLQGRTAGISRSGARPERGRTEAVR